MTSHGGSWWHSALTVVFGLVASLSVPLSIVASWSVNTVIRTNHYEATLDPLAKNRDFTSYLATKTTALLTGALPANAPIVGNAPAFHTVRRDVNETFASPSFARLWDQAVRASHPAAVDVLTGKAAAGVQTTNGVVVDLSPILNSVVSQLDLDHIHDFDAIRTSLVASHPLEIRVLSASQLREARGVFGALSDLRWAVVIAGIGGLVGALALARRRLRVLAAILTGALVCTGLSVLGLSGVRALAVHRAPAAGVDQTLSAAVLDTIFHSLWFDLYATLAVTGVLAAAAWLVVWRWPNAPAPLRET